MKNYYVYILTNKHHTVLYVGMTNNLERRLSEHRGNQSFFTQWYRVHKLVYYEDHADVTAAISREKQIKKWSRKKKHFIIELDNPEWRDLSH